jgi:multidrug efflux system membrane fusion protein
MGVSMSHKNISAKYSQGSTTVVAILSLLLIGGAFYYWFTYTKKDNSSDTQKKHSVKPMSVVSAVAKSSDMNISINSLGTIVPTTAVTVKTLVDGQLMKIYYHEGQTVHAGEKLALVDPRSYEVALEQSQGQLAKDQALLDNARIDLKRYEDLRRQNSVSIQIYDTQKALVHQYEGGIKVDMAAVKNAKLQLSYCSITSPISGRVGLRPVDIGNIVHPSDQNGIATVTTLQPITALFSIPEENVRAVMQKFQSHEKIPVDAYDRSDTNKLQSGVLVSVDNQIDPATGTLKLRAEFVNKELTLFPNQFVNIHLLSETLHNAITIPQVAVQYGSKGGFVYVIDANNSVHVRAVKTGFAQAGNIVVQNGLSAGESVVIDGLDKLRDKMKVSPIKKDAVSTEKRQQKFKKEQ